MQTEISTWQYPQVTLPIEGIRVWNPYQEEDFYPTLHKIENTPSGRRFKLDNKWFQETNNKNAFYLHYNDGVYLKKENTTMRNINESPQNYNQYQEQTSSFSLPHLVDLLNNPVDSQEFSHLMSLFPYIEPANKHNPDVCGSSRDRNDLARRLTNLYQNGQIDELFEQLDRCIGARLADMYNFYHNRPNRWSASSEESHKIEAYQILKLKSDLLHLQEDNIPFDSIQWNGNTYVVVVPKPNFSQGRSRNPMRRGGKRKVTRRKMRKSKKTRKH